MSELQLALANAKLDTQEAKEDRSRVFEMLELLKAKYSTLLEEKSKQSSELIKVSISSPFHCTASPFVSFIAPPPHPSPLMPPLG